MPLPSARLVATAAARKPDRARRRVAPASFRHSLLSQRASCQRVASAWGSLARSCICARRPPALPALASAEDTRRQQRGLPPRSLAACPCPRPPTPWQLLRSCSATLPCCMPGRWQLTWCLACASLQWGTSPARPSRTTTPTRELSVACDGDHRRGAPVMMRVGPGPRTARVRGARGIEQKAKQQEVVTSATCRAVVDLVRGTAKSAVTHAQTKEDSGARGNPRDIDADSAAVVRVSERQVPRHGDAHGGVEDGLRSAHLGADFHVYVLPALEYVKGNDLV